MDWFNSDNISNLDNNSICMKTNSQQMRRILEIIIIIFILSTLSCKTKIVCGFGYEYSYDGKGLESELISCESVGIMDTVLARVKTKVGYINEIQEEKNGIGVNIVISKTGEEEMLLGGVTNINGILSLIHI